MLSLFALVSCANNNPLLYPVKSGDKWGFADKDGNVLVAPVFDEVSPWVIAHHKFPVCVNGKWGCIKADGTYLIKPEYDELFPFLYGIAKVRIGNKYGIINENNEIVIPIKYDRLPSYGGDGLFHVFLNGKDYFIDWDDNVVFDGSPFDAVSQHGFSEDAIGVCKNGKWGFADTNGKLIVDMVYESVAHFYNGYVAVRTKDGWGIIDRKGEIIVKPAYHNIKEVSENMAVVEKGDLCGYVNTDGALVIPLRYDFADKFVNGKAVVCEKGVFYKIDKSGENRERIEPDLDYVLEKIVLREVFEGLSDKNIAGEFDLFKRKIKKEYPALREIRFCISTDLLGNLKEQPPSVDDEKQSIPVSAMGVRDIPLIMEIRYLCRCFNAEYEIIDKNTILILPKNKDKKSLREVKIKRLP